MQIITTLQKLNILPHSKVLVVVPHPGDEAAYIGGLMIKMSSKNIHFDLVCLTNGGASTLRYGLSTSDDLSKVRMQELRKTSFILGVKTLIKYDFNDGELEADYSEMKELLKQEIKRGKTDVVIALEPFGIYGHKDNIVSSKVIREIFQEIGGFKLIYVTAPVEYFLSDNLNFGKIMKAEYKFKVGVYGAFKKMQACKANFTQFGKNKSFWQKWQELDWFENEYFTIAKK